MSDVVASALAELVGLVGADRVSNRAADRLAYRHGTWPVEYKAVMERTAGEGPNAVVWPATADQVQAVVSWAARRHIPLIPYGGGSGIVGGTMASPGSVVVDVKSLRDLTFDAESQVVEVGCGWIGSELERRLKIRYGATLGHYPQSLHSSTVGGWLATRATGIMSTKHGRLEDRVEGLEVVTGTGQLLWLGGGPPASEGPDLVRLFLGSEGRMGIITKARLRVEPADQPEAIRAWMVSTVGQGLAFLQWVVQNHIRPTVTRLFDLEESAIWFGDAVDAGAVVLLHFQGLAALVTAEVAVAEEQARQYGARRLPDEVARRWWARRFDTSGLLRTLRSASGIAETIEVGASWSNLLGVYDGAMKAVRPLCKTAYAHFSHFYASGGSVYIIVHAEAEEREGETPTQRYQKILTAVLGASLQAGGGVSHHHGIGRARASWLERAHPDSVSVLRRVQAALDPAGIFNPGVLLPEVSL